MVVRQLCIFGIHKLFVLLVGMLQGWLYFRKYRNTDSWIVKNLASTLYFPQRTDKRDLRPFSCSLATLFNTFLFVVNQKSQGHSPVTDELVVAVYRYLVTRVSNKVLRVCSITHFCQCTTIRWQRLYWTGLFFDR